MRKKLVCLLLALAVCLSLAGCGGVSYGVNPVMTLVSQDYSMPSATTTWCITTSSPRWRK